ncbi:MAG: serine/threonine-protein kinase PknK [Acidimicrobiia bacterium]
MPPEDDAVRYEILEVLGREGVVEVARAVDRHRGHDVALQLTHLGDGVSRDDVVAAGRELLRIRPHPALPTVRDEYFLDDDTYVLVMDWVEGTPLSQFIEERGDPGLPLGTALVGLEPVGGALEHLHTHDPPVIHGDVRPENVLIGAGGKLSLLFGVGAAVHDARALDDPYRAPELRDRTFSRASDVFALAATTQYALTGSPPAPGDSLADSGLAPDLARRLERVLRRALDPDPSRRPPGALDFVERLSAAREATVPSGVVTFVLTDVEGSTDLWEAHPEAMVRVMMRHYEIAADTAEAHGGRMPRSQGEGDSTLTAYARASDAIEAVLEFQRSIRNEAWPDGIELRVRAGLHTGEAFVEHGDYFGAALSRAARVRSLARGGQVFLSQATVELIADQLPDGVSLQDRGRVRLKGLQRAEEVHELCAPDMPVLDTAPLVAPTDEERTRLPLPTSLLPDRVAFVDRDVELAAVRALWEQVTDDWRRRLVMVNGDPGIGKSRFAAEVARRCYDVGGTVLHGRCYEENVVPYQPFVELLEHVARTGAPGEVRADIVNSGTLLTRLVPDMALRFPDLPDPVRAEPGTERYLVFEAVNSMLSEVAKRAPLLVVLDDLHWADLETIALLGHVVRSAHAAPLLVVGTSRVGEVGPDHPLAVALADLRRDAIVEEIRLTGLDDDGVAELVSSSLTFDPDPAFLSSIGRETGGNPFFIREICSHVGETGAAAQAFTLETLGVPEGVKQVIAQRIARLPDGAAQLLTVGAVVGREFDIDVVLRVDGRDEESALDLLDEACAARLVEEIPGRIGSYSFVHALTREALYDSLGATRRARLHRRVAEALEREHELHLDRHLGELAYHYAQAGTELAKAVEYARRAGDQALGRFAHEEAAAHFERGLALLSEPEGEHCDLLLGLAEARRRAGDVPGSQQAFAEAGVVARARGDADRLARAAIGNFRGHILATPAWHGPTIELLEEALDALPDEDGVLRSRVLAALALELYFTPARERGLVVAEQGVEMARRTGDDEALAFALACAHTAISDPDHLQIRLDLTTELIAVGRRLGDAELELVGHVDRSADLLESIEVEEARREAALATEIVDELGQPMQRYFVMWLQSTLELLAGRFDEAERLSNEALTIAMNANHPDAYIVWGTQALVLAWQRGDTSHLLEPARQLLGEFPDLTSWPAAVALVEAGAGELDAARERLVAFVDRLDHLTFGGTWLPAMMAITDVARVTEEASVAERIMRPLEPYADRICVVSLNVTEFGPVSRSLGVLATLLGDHDLATEHFEHALGTSRAIGARAHVARVSVDYARMLTARRAAGDDARVASLLDSASASAEQLGMLGLQRDIDALHTD